MLLRGAILILSIVIVIFTAPAVAWAQCPASTAFCVGQTHLGEEEFNVTETSTDPTLAVSFASSSASFDLAEGRLSAVAWVDDVYDHHSGASAVDVFVMNGVPGTFLKVRLHISLFLITDPSGRMAWAGSTARLTVGDQSVEAASLGPNMVPFIELEVVALAGQPFTITYETTAWGYGYYPVAEVNCRLEFLDLPPGADITSCNGFGSVPVPVESRTWGGVKALYR